MSEYSLSASIKDAANITYGENSIIVPANELPIDDPVALDLYVTEVVATDVRLSRFAKLASCDYIMMIDYPLFEDKRLAWMSYRQALRDISAQPGFPFHVEWPQEPQL